MGCYRNQRRWRYAVELVPLDGCSGHHCLVAEVEVGAYPPPPHCPDWESRYPGRGHIYTSAHVSTHFTQINPIPSTQCRIPFSLDPPTPGGGMSQNRESQQARWPFLPVFFRVDTLMKSCSATPIHDAYDKANDSEVDPRGLTW